MTMDERTASQKAALRWAGKELRLKAPWPCQWCSRSFGTEKGRNQHHSYCFQNPLSRRYTVGGWDGNGEREPIIKNGRVVGFVWRGVDEVHGARIKRDMKETLKAIGIEE